jgi:hypothetical protein
MSSWLSSVAIRRSNCTPGAAEKSGEMRVARQTKLMEIERSVRPRSEAA